MSKTATAELEPVRTNLTRQEDRAILRALCTTAVSAGTDVVENLLGVSIKSVDLEEEKLVSKPGSNGAPEIASGTDGIIGFLNQVRAGQAECKPNNFTEDRLVRVNRG